MSRWSRYPEPDPARRAAQQQNELEARISVQERRQLPSQQRAYVASDPAVRIVDLAAPSNFPVSVSLSVPSSAVWVAAYLELDVFDATANAISLVLSEPTDGTLQMIVLAGGDLPASSLTTVATGEGTTFTPAGGVLVRTGWTGGAVPGWGRPHIFRATPGTRTYTPQLSLNGSGTGGYVEGSNLRLQMWVL